MCASYRLRILRIIKIKFKNTLNHVDIWNVNDTLAVTFMRISVTHHEKKNMMSKWRWCKFSGMYTKYARFQKLNKVFIPNKLFCFKNFSNLDCSENQKIKKKKKNDPFLVMHVIYSITMSDKQYVECSMNHTLAINTKLQTKDINRTWWSAKTDTLLDYGITCSPPTSSQCLLGHKKLLSL